MFWLSAGKATYVKALWILYKTAIQYRNTISLVIFQTGLPKMISLNFFLNHMFVFVLNCTFLFFFVVYEWSSKSCSWRTLLGEYVCFTWSSSRIWWHDRGKNLLPRSGNISETENIAWTLQVIDYLLITIVYQKNEFNRIFNNVRNMKADVN